ncbi:MAG: hypothetical protein R3Y09_08445 [Clostridia bacterium]
MKNADRLIRVIFRHIISMDLICSSKIDIRDDVLSFFNTKFRDCVCKKYMELYPDNYSFDEMKILLDEEVTKLQDYFKTKEVDPLHMFIYYADKLFRIQNNKIIVSFNDLFDWHGFSTKIDGNVFQGAFLRRYKNQNCDGIIEHDEQRIYKILSKGIYENHMHLYGSGYTWEMNLKNLVLNSPLAVKNKKSNMQEYSEFDQLHLYRMQVIRTYLLWVLLDKNVSLIEKEENFDILKVLSSESNMFLLFDRLQEIYVQAEMLFEKYKGEYQDIALMEREFFRLMFLKLESDTLTFIEKNLFKIYIAEMSNIKFRFVQDNIGMGFAKFSDVQNIKTQFLKSFEKDKIIETVLDKYYSEKCILGIEVRIAPSKPEDLTKIIKKLSQANEKVWSSHRRKDAKVQKIKIGIIIHYIKVDEETLDFECRHSTLREKLRKESTYLSKYFERISQKTEKDDISIIGIDAANVEIQCAPEVFAPIFRKHRKEISKRHKLGFTYHVGEDFVNISSGLRAIDDVIEFMNFDRNDRLGHAIALGIDIDKYLSTKRKVVISTLQGLVDDISWLHKFLECACADKLYLRSELLFMYQEYAHSLFEDTGIETPDITTYQMSYSLRGDLPEYSIREDILCMRDSFAINGENSFHNKSINNSKARELYKAYHYNSRLKANGKKSIILKVNEVYMNACKIAQELLHEKIHQKGITIETNPTSNKKISHVRTYKELPLWRFNSYGITKEDDNARKNLQVSINTDDSAIFETNLVNEYSCIALALIKEGYQREEVMNFIEYLREMSRQTTFL